MTTKKILFKAGTRSSRLARVQTRDALDRMEACFPACAFEDVPISSPGDRDLATDLRQSPPDFFTQDLDRQVLDRKSTRLNSSQAHISYAVFCLKKKKKHTYSRVITTSQGRGVSCLTSPCCC